MTTPADDDLTLNVKGTALKGWKRIRVTRGVERMPSDFDIELTDIAPDDATGVTAKPGDRCQVLLGSELVITGFVNVYSPTIDKAAHSIRVTGRSLSQDLVDCSAEWPNGQIVGTDALDVAQKLAKPYGVKVSCASDKGPTIPQFNLTIGDSAFAIIERVCRYSALVAYDLPDGSVVLNRAGKGKSGGAIKQGENVERATFTWNDAEQFSKYEVYGLSISTLADKGIGFNLVATATDPNMTRHRKKFTVCEAGAAGEDISKQRAQWEAARRAGRAHKIQVRVDSWRDKPDGKLWEPNTLVVVDLPAWKIEQEVYCIGEVSFIRDQSGTHADLVLMLPDSYLPQPVLLLPYRRDITGAGAPSATTGKPPAPSSTDPPPQR